MENRLERPLLRHGAVAPRALHMSDCVFSWTLHRRAARLVLSARHFLIQGQLTLSTLFPFLPTPLSFYSPFRKPCLLITNFQENLKTAFKMATMLASPATFAFQKMSPLPPDNANGRSTLFSVASFFWHFQFRVLQKWQFTNLKPFSNRQLFHFCFKKFY